ncbi:MAG: acetate kinase [Candidatus Omnitrophica bacterium]|nr:acetate kinase [Candidatus Omnitrophota bacterium]
MKILILNSGSSSLKYKLFDIENDFQMLATGVVGRIGLKQSSIKYQAGSEKPVSINQPVASHKLALELIRNLLTDPKNGVIKDLSEIKGIGHRVVHGAEKFSDSVLITDEVIAAIKGCCDLAPLHNPPNLLGIEACHELLHSVPQVAVFDTAFHQTMPKKAFLYGLDYNQYVKYGVRRYGFHGTSHQYVSSKAAEILNTDIKNLKIITCHLGNGCSLTAINGGKSVDTSMGLTPLEGVLMGTRCGDIDPYVTLYILDKEGLTLDEINRLFNNKSGLLGLCGKSDMRDVISQIEKKDEMAKVAADVYVYRIVKYIGAYAAAMNGVNVIVFTAGVGENCSFIRTEIMKYLTFLGITIDEKKNEENACIISTPESKVKVLIVPTNEELVIAHDTYKIIKDIA